MFLMTKDVTQDASSNRNEAVRVGAGEREEKATLAENSARPRIAASVTRIISTHRRRPRPV